MSTTRYFHMTDEYEIVAVSKQKFENPEPSWPNNTMVVTKTDDNMIDIQVNMSNVTPGDIREALEWALAT